jgi:hypothetical protein
MITQQEALNMLRHIWGTPTGYDLGALRRLAAEALSGEHPMRTAARIAQCPKLLNASPFDFLLVKECVDELEAEAEVAGDNNFER